MYTLFAVLNCDSRRADGDLENVYTGQLLEIVHYSVPVAPCEAGRLDGTQLVAGSTFMNSNSGDVT